MTAKMTATEASGQTRATRLWARPTSSPATMEPSRLPSPASATTTKAMPSMSTPIQGFSPRIGAVSAPATPASTDPRAHDGAVARLLEEKPGAEHEERGRHHHEEAVLRVERDSEVDAATQERRRELAHAHGAPDDDDALRDDEREAEREEELVVVPGFVEGPYPAIFDQDAQESHAQGSQEERQPEVADELDHRVEKIGAEGEEGAVGEVGDIEHAGDDGQSDAHEGVEHARSESVEDLAEEESGLHAAERPMGRFRTRGVTCLSPRLGAAPLSSNIDVR
jgi:hypothetical protein